MSQNWALLNGLGDTLPHLKLSPPLLGLCTAAEEASQSCKVVAEAVEISEEGRGLGGAEGGNPAAAVPPPLTGTKGVTIADTDGMVARAEGGTRTETGSSQSRGEGRYCHHDFHHPDCHISLAMEAVDRQMDHA